MGKKLLAFTKKSLLRLLERANCTEELYDRFLLLCKENGILNQNERTIKVGEKTITAVTFLLGD